MSDFSIPGVSSRFNTDKMVEELVNAERVNLNRLENRVDQFEVQRTTWQDMSRQLSRLQVASRNLYNFENPFNERKAVSNNETSIIATASRNATEGSTEVRVVNLAQSDRLSSKDLTRDQRVEQGVYTFQVGQTPITVRFRGGTLREFSDSLNRVNPNVLTSTVINNRPGSQVFVLESHREGSENPIQFHDEAARELATSLGIIGPGSRPPRPITLTPENLRDVQGTKLTEGINLQQNTVTVLPEQTVSITLPSENQTTTGQLNFVARFQDSPSQAQAPTPPPGFSLSPTQGVFFQGIQLPDKASDAPQPSIELPPPPTPIETNSVLFLKTGNQEVQLSEMNRDGDTEISVSLDTLSDIPSAIIVKNLNTERNVIIQSIATLAPEKEQDFIPINPLSRAQDAIIQVQGIEVIRSSNVIDDVIPGVTLNLEAPSDQPVSIRVTPDRDKAKEAIIEYVAMYNQVIRDINILTRNQPDIIDEITYFTPEEREDALVKLGSFQGNSTLNTVRQRLQNITLSAIQTRAGRDVSLLSHIGISTNASGGGGSTLNVSRLRGYLEINEQRLDQVLAQNFLAVRDIFGMDSDGDLIVDTGIGYSTEELLRPFTQTGGILASNTQTLDSQITRTQTDIENYQRYLEDYETRMKTQFGRMESAINSLESQSRELEGLNPQNNNN